MKFIIALALFALCQGAPAPDMPAKKVVAILRDERIQEPGSYHFDIETEDGIVRSEAGQSSGEAGAVNQQGEISFPLPNGETFHLKFVANENGYHPESPFLPVAPAFPHPIPDFVLEQIEKARIEDEEAARNASK